MVEDRGDFGLRALQQQADPSRTRPGRCRIPTRRPPAAALVMQPNVFRADAPQLFANINRSQCMTLGVSMADVNDTLQIYLGSLYVNDFNLFGRTWQVIAQADAPFRNRRRRRCGAEGPQHAGGMVPLGTAGRRPRGQRTADLTRYNMFPASAINGYAGPGISSRQAIDMMQHWPTENSLPGMICEWTEMAYLELQAGNTAMYIFGLAVLEVFLVLAAQYESGRCRWP